MIRVPIIAGILLAIGPLARGAHSSADNLSQQAIGELTSRVNAATDPAELGKLGDEVEADYSELEPAQYAQLMLTIISHLGNAPTSDSQAHIAHAKLADAALSHLNVLPPKTAVRIVRYRWTDLTSLSDTAATTERKRDAKIWIAVWKHVQDAIDPSWDAKNRPVPPHWPAGEDGANGSSPAIIKDPAKRDAYVAAVDVFRKQQELYNEQKNLREVDSQFIPVVAKQLADYLRSSRLSRDDLEHEFIADGFPKPRETELWTALEKIEETK